MLITAKLKIRARATLPDRSGEFNQAWAFSGVRNWDRIETGKACWRKNAQKGLTFARLSSIEIKLKRFLKVRRDQAPAKPDSWSSAGRF